MPANEKVDKDNFVVSKVKEKDINLMFGEKKDLFNRVLERDFSIENIIGHINKLRLNQELVLKKLKISKVNSENHHKFNTIDLLENDFESSEVYLESEPDEHFDINNQKTSDEALKRLNKTHLETT